MVSIADIQQLADRIAGIFDPDGVILFGSYAYGVPGPDADVDLLVILAHQDKNWRIAAAIRGRVGPGFPLDLMVRTPEEIKRRLAAGDPFLQEVTKRGRVLYARAHDRVG